MTNETLNSIIDNRGYLPLKTVLVIFMHNLYHPLSFRGKTKTRLTLEMCNYDRNYNGNH